MRTEEEIRKALGRSRDALKRASKRGDAMMIAGLAPLVSALEWALGADNSYADLQRNCEESEINSARAKRQ